MFVTAKFVQTRQRVCVCARARACVRVKGVIHIPHLFCSDVFRKQFMLNQSVPVRQKDTVGYTTEFSNGPIGFDITTNGQNNFFIVSSDTVPVVGQAMVISGQSEGHSYPVQAIYFTSKLK